LPTVFGKDYAIGGLWQRFFVCTRRKLLEYIQGLLGRKIERSFPAEDVLHDVCVASYGSKACPGESEEEFLAWLRVFARHQVENLRRSQGYKKRCAQRILSLEDLAGGGLLQIVSREPSPEKELIERERREKVNLAVEKLEKRNADLVTLVYLKDIPVASAAKRLGVSPSTAYKRLRFSLGRLRMNLADLEESDSA